MTPESPMSPRDPPPAWPSKRRELINPYMDSTIWNDFRFRTDDVVIATWGKSGCTWLQQIVGQLIFDGADAIPIGEASSWIEFAPVPRSQTLQRLDAQAHRRFLKTHLPVDALVYSRQARYLYVARDGRDVAWSAFNHMRRNTRGWYVLINRFRSQFGRVPAGPPSSFREFFRQWLDEDGYPFWPFFSHVQSWWDLRGLPNLMLLHFEQLRRTLPETLHRIAAFLDIRVSEQAWPRILEHVSLDHMRATADCIIPRQTSFTVTGGAQAFFEGGGKPRWSDVLDAEDLERYERLAATRLSVECRAWLREGALRG